MPTPDFTLSLNNRSLAIDLSAAAKDALAKRNGPLFAQMELYFSCLLRLKVRFYDAAPAMETPWLSVSDKLLVSFRPVMTAQCNNDYQGEEPPLTDFPIAHDAPFTPRWLQLDYRQGQWQGEFGYHQDE
jgi:hypothetical protein